MQGWLDEKSQYIEGRVRDAVMRGWIERERGVTCFASSTHHHSSQGNLCKSLSSCGVVYLFHTKIFSSKHYTRNKTNKDVNYRRFERWERR